MFRGIVIAWLTLWAVTSRVEARIVSPDSVLATGLPVVYVTTADGRALTCTYVSAPEGAFGAGITNASRKPGRMSIWSPDSLIYNSGSYVSLESGMSVWINGTETAYFPKKPYHIHLEKPADLIAILNGESEEDGADTEWELFYDFETLNSMLGLEINRMVGMEWTPRYRYVNVILNGNYRGVYMLMESVRHGPSRMRCPDNGFIITYDAYWWNDKRWICTPTNHHYYTFLYPDSTTMSVTLADSISTLADSLENACQYGTYSGFIDQRSFASWILAHDLLGTRDIGSADIHFIYSPDADEPFSMGTLWQFIHAMETPGKWSVMHTDLFHPRHLLHNENHDFVSVYKNRWEEMNGEPLDDVCRRLDSFRLSPTASALQRSLLLDYERWRFPTPTVNALIDSMLQWISERREWIDTNIRDVYSVDDTARIINIGLPVMFIETVNKKEPTATYVMSSDSDSRTIINATKVPGRLRIVDGDSTLYDSGDYRKGKQGMTIKLRGNWTAWLKKHPYKVKLEQMADLLGGNRADRDWALLNAGTNLNTQIGFDVSRLAGMPWTPRMMYVNVIMNGSYRGLYILCETVKRGDNRIHIGSDGGFLIENDAYWWKESLCLQSESGAYYTFKYPDEDDIDDIFLDTVTTIINNMNQAVRLAGYVDVIDTATFASWLLTHDILGSYDAMGSNIFLLRQDLSDTARMEMGPPWDFDNIMGDSADWSKEHTEIQNFRHLFANYVDRSFVKAYKERWAGIQGAGDSMIAMLDSLERSPLAEKLQLSRDLDSMQWADRHTTLEDDIIAAKRWFSTHTPWLDSAIASLDAPLVISLSGENRASGNIIFDLAGRRVTQLKKGVFIIDRKKKIIIR